MKVLASLKKSTQTTEENKRKRHVGSGPGTCFAERERVREREREEREERERPKQCYFLFFCFFLNSFACFGLLLERERETVGGLIFFSSFFF